MKSIHRLLDIVDLAPLRELRSIYMETTQEPVDSLRQLHRPEFTPKHKEYLIEMIRNQTIAFSLLKTKTFTIACIKLKWLYRSNTAHLKNLIRETFI